MRRFEHRPPAFPTRHPASLAAVQEQLANQDWTRLEGAPELEADLAAFHGPDCQGRPPLPWFISSGTAALEAIMLGHGIGPGDEVVTTPYTWGATVSAILAIGAIPRFADIDPVSGLLTPQGVAAALTPASRAVLVVHLFGHPVDLAGMRSLCDERSLLLLEDGSQAHGARFQGRLVGDWGDAAAFSCMGMKLLAGSEGGYALFRDRSAAETAWLYGKHPRGLDAETAERLGDAGLLDALQLGWRNSALSALLVQHGLPHLQQEVAARRRNAAVLREQLADCALVEMPEELPGAEAAYHLLSLIWRGPLAQREAFRQALVARGVDAFIYIPTPIHRLKRLNPHAYQGPAVFWHAYLRQAGVDYRQTSCPGAEQRAISSLEMAFNWTEYNNQVMKDLAASIKDAAEAV